LRELTSLSIQGPRREMTAETLTSMRELHSRTTDGILVRLLWCEHDNRVFVSVSDNRTGEAFSVEVPKGERALQVFDHPYAYAA
jgi:hypothetical protein